MHLRGLALGILGLGLSTVACGSTSSSPGANDSPDAADGDTAAADAPIDTAAIEAACGKFATALVANQERCGSLLIAPTDAQLANLIERWKLKCTSALTLPGSKVAPEDMIACASAASSASCEIVFDPSFDCKYPAGTLPNGAPCSIREQCGSYNCHRDPTDAPCGVCAPLPAIGDKCAWEEGCVEGAVCTAGTCVAAIHRGVGEHCDLGSAEVCDRELDCDFITTHTCQARGADGEPCSAAAGCKPGLACASGHICRPVTIATEGQPCGSLMNCAWGLTCDTSSKTCAKVIAVPPEGDCSGPHTTCERGTCNSITKRCPKLVADGEACTSDYSVNACELLATCTQGKCLMRETTVCK